MYYGIILHFKLLKYDEKLLEDVISLYDKSFDKRINSFELSEKSTEKTIKSKNLKEISDLINFSGKYRDISSSCAEDDCFSFDGVVSGYENDFFPFNVSATFYNKINDYNVLLDFFDKFNKLFNTYYGYAVFNEKFNYVVEELSYIPISDVWLTGNHDEERERYLLGLQGISGDLGLMVPEIYPINYFSDHLDYRKLLKYNNELNDDWDFIKTKTGTIIKFKREIEWDSFIEERKEIVGRKEVIAELCNKREEKKTKRYNKFLQ